MKLSRVSSPLKLRNTSCFGVGEQEEDMKIAEVDPNIVATKL
jgi:hypothetical protein